MHEENRIAGVDNKTGKIQLNSPAAGGEIAGSWGGNKCATDFNINAYC